MSKLSFTKLIAVAFCTLTAAQAQHTINFSAARWMHNGTIFTVPQSNTDTDIVAGGGSTATATANYFTAGGNGAGRILFGTAIATASTSANGGAQGSYTYVGGGLNGTVRITGTHSAGGSVSSAGNTRGSFSASAAYTNSVNTSGNSATSWLGGLVIATVPGTIGNPMAIFVANNFSWSSSSASALVVQVRGAGAQLTTSCSATAATVTNLN